MNFLRRTDFKTEQWHNFHLSEEKGFFFLVGTSDKNEDVEVEKRHTDHGETEYQRGEAGSQLLRSGKMRMVTENVIGTNRGC